MNNKINWEALYEHWAQEIDIENELRKQSEVKSFDYPYY